MCLIALALHAHPRYRLVVTANRDEFHARPSAPASWWDDAPDLFGGRDLQQHGSWMALARDGRWAAVTNVRRMVPPDPLAPSRGRLVAEYLRSSTSADAYVQALTADAARYAGYNLLTGDATRVIYSSNTPHPQQQVLRPGIHAVSNTSLDTPWPKLLRLRTGLARWCAAGDEDFTTLFSQLADDAPARDDELPDTGVGLEMERFLSSPFIRSDRYGTRSCTVLAVTTTGAVHYHERRYGPQGVYQGETVEYLQLA